MVLNVDDLAGSAFHRHWQRLGLFQSGRPRLEAAPFIHSISIPSRCLHEGTEAALFTARLQWNDRKWDRCWTALTSNQGGRSTSLSSWECFITPGQCWLAIENGIGRVR